MRLNCESVISAYKRIFGLPSAPIEESDAVLVLVSVFEALGRDPDEDANLVEMLNDGTLSGLNLGQFLAKVEIATGPEKGEQVVNLVCLRYENEASELGEQLARLDRAEWREELLRSPSLMLEEAQMAKIQRAESHLRRAANTCLQELQSLQEVRSG